MELALTVITVVAVAGDVIVENVVYSSPSAPELPAETTTTTPALTAFAYAAANGSQGVPAASPQAAPVSEGLYSAGKPDEIFTTSIPSFTASLIARMNPLSGGQSSTPG